MRAPAEAVLAHRFRDTEHDINQQTMTLLPDRLTPGTVLTSPDGVRCTVSGRRGRDQYGQPRYLLRVPARRRDGWYVPTHTLRLSRDELQEAGYTTTEGGAE